MRERLVFGWIVVFLAGSTVAAPLSFIATISLMPLWSWVERAFGIESVGHSGPATWCFVTAYAFLMTVIISLVAVRSRRSRRD